MLSLLPALTPKSSNVCNASSTEKIGWGPASPLPPSPPRLAPLFPVGASGLPRKDLSSLPLLLCPHRIHNQ